MILRLNLYLLDIPHYAIQHTKKYMNAVDRSFTLCAQHRAGRLEKGPSPWIKKNREEPQNGRFIRVQAVSKSSQLQF